MSKWVRSIAWLTFALALACVGGKASAGGGISGTAIYRERMALPPNAMFEASLEEVSRAAAPAKVIARTRVNSARTPIHFMLMYDHGAVQPDERYVVRGRITVDGAVWFTGQSTVSPPTGDGLRHVTLLLRRAGGAAGHNIGRMPLETTDWKLRELDGATVAPAGPAQEAWLTLDPATHRMSGFAGCNHVTGDYALAGERLTFSHVAATLRMCLHDMKQEQAFLKALPTVDRWRISGTRLTLLDKEGAAIAAFEAAPKR